MNISPSQEQIRAAIDTQICPWCGKGPFAMLAVHVTKIHEIDKWELRDLAGLTTRQALCSAEVSEKMREANLENPHLEKMQEAAKRGRKPGRWTAAGIEKNTSTIVEWTQADTERHRTASAKAGAARTPVGRERSRAAASEWGKAHRAELRERALRVLQTPEAKANRAAARAAKARPCGTRAAYRRGCRCGRCVEANRKYKREQYQKSRYGGPHDVA